MISLKEKMRTNRTRGIKGEIWNLLKEVKLSLNQINTRHPKMNQRR